MMIRPIITSILPISFYAFLELSSPILGTLSGFNFFAAIWTLTTLIYLFYFFVTIIKGSLKSATHLKMKRDFEPIVQDLDVRNRHRVFGIVVDLMKKMMIGGCLAIFNGSLQLWTILIVEICHIVYILKVRPPKSIVLFIQVLISEILFFCAVITCFLYTRVSSERDDCDNLLKGWLFLGFAVGNLAINVMFSIIICVGGIYNSFTSRRVKIRPSLPSSFNPNSKLNR
jgi:hypothetical protein